MKVEAILRSIFANPFVSSLFVDSEFGAHFLDLAESLLSHYIYIENI